MSCFKLKRGTKAPLWRLALGTPDKAAANALNRRTRLSKCLSSIPGRFQVTGGCAAALSLAGFVLWQSFGRRSQAAVLRAAKLYANADQGKDVFEVGQGGYLLNKG